MMAVEEAVVATGTGPAGNGGVKSLSGLGVFSATVWWCYLGRIIMISSVLT